MRKLYLLLLLTLAAYTSYATIRNVPMQYNTIQAAIDSSLNGDTVLVHPGTYFENLKLKGKSIVLTSLYYLNNDTSYISQTIINGSQPVNPDSASCIMMVDHQDSTMLVQGFTLTGGKGTKWKDIHNNLMYREGGAILMEFCSATIRNNVMIYNEAINNTGVSSSGGGAIRSGDGNPKIINNVIMYNKGRYGAGIVFNYSTGLVKNNLICYNSGGQDYGGGGIWMTGTNTNTVVEIENNTIVHNTCTGNNSNGGGQAAGVMIFTIKASIKNNIIWGNTQTAGGPVVKLFGGIYEASYNDVQSAIAGPGNIKVDPKYDTLNFYLSDSSLCIDAGDSSAIYNDTEDVQHTGLAKYPSKGNLRNDMGAYGGPNALLPPVRFNSVGISYSKKNNPLSVRCFPNPTSNGAVISYIVSKRTKVQVTIIDMNGREVMYSEAGAKSSGQHFHQVDTSTLPKGLYSGALRAGDEVQYFKIVIN